MTARLAHHPENADRAVMAGAPLMAPQDFSFEEPPARGSVVMYRGQRYVASAVEPYVRRDGVETVLVTWSSHCTRCGDPFDRTFSWTSGKFRRRCTPCADVVGGQAVVRRARRRRGGR